METIDITEISKIHDKSNIGKPLPVIHDEIEININMELGQNHDQSEIKKEHFMLRNYDPESLILLIDKYATVKIIKNVVFHGFIRCIDPITYSVVLAIPKAGSFQTTFIPGHAVIDIVQETTPENVQPPVRKILLSEMNPEMEIKKKKIIAWFKWNLLPVSEEDEKIVVRTVTILPPFNVSNIYADNPVIALQIRKIMETMPEDFTV